MSRVKRSDWVRCIKGPKDVVGIVTRVARDGSWADVKWPGWSKRMPTHALEVVTTLRRQWGPWEVEVTDWTREQELREAMAREA